MRHNYKGRKLGTSPSHTKAMKRSLTQALLYNDRIKTIESRAKEIRPEVDRIITWAKKGDLHSRRLAIARLGGDKELVREVFEKVAQGMFADRNGGYTRIMKLGPRKGDGAPMVIIELVTEPVAKKSAPAKAKKAKKTAPKKVQKTKVEEAEEVIEETVTEAVEAEAENTPTPKEEVMEEMAEVVEEKEAAEAAADAAPADQVEETAEAKEAEEVKEEETKAEEAQAEEVAAAEADTADAKEEEATK